MVGSRGAESGDGSTAWFLWHVDEKFMGEQINEGAQTSWKSACTKGRSPCPTLGSFQLILIP